MRIEYDAPHDGWEPIGQPVPVIAPPGAMVGLYMAGADLVFEITTPGRRSVAVFMSREDRGLPPAPSRKGTPVTDEERARMVALHNEGRNMGEIAQELGRSESLVYHVLDEADVRRRRKRKRRSD